MLKKIMLMASAVILLAAVYLGPSAAIWLEAREYARQAKEPYDVLILLSGERKCRIDNAVEAYKTQMAPRIIVSGGPTYESGKSEAEFIADELVNRGIPRHAVLAEPKAESTWENALFTRDMMLRYNWQKAVVVTSNYHMRRARAIFNGVFAKSGLNIGYLPAVSETYSAAEWWKKDAGRTYVFREYIKMIYYLLIGRISLSELL